MIEYTPAFLVQTNNKICTFLCKNSFFFYIVILFKNISLLILVKIIAHP